jgi:hypothetical protein
VRNRLGIKKTLFKEKHLSWRKFPTKEQEESDVGKIFTQESKY